MRVVGIDLSLTATGIAAITNQADQPPICHVQVHGRDGLTDHKRPLADRAFGLDNLARELLDRILFDGTLPLDSATCDLVLIELSPPTRAAGAVWERGYLWWSVVNGLTRADITVVDVPPSLIKTYATGTGNAGKGSIIDAVARRWPAFETRGDDNAADASVLAAMAADLLDQPLCSMPATHRRALDKVQLPAVSRG